MHNLFVFFVFLTIPINVLSISPYKPIYVNIVFCFSALGRILHLEYSAYCSASIQIIPKMQKLCLFTVNSETKITRYIDCQIYF